MNVYVVTSRPVGWGSLAMGRSVVLVARSFEEAEGQAIVKLGLEDRRIVPAEQAQKVLGTGEADRKGLRDAAWLSTWEVDFHSSNVSVGGVTLKDLITAYDMAQAMGGRS